MMFLQRPLLSLTCTLGAISALACASTPTSAEGGSQLAVDAVTVCSAGVEISKERRAALIAELSDITKGKGSVGVEAQVKSAVKGIAFKDQDLTNDNVKAVYEKYADCVTKNLTNLKSP